MATQRFSFSAELFLIYRECAPMKIVESEKPKAKGRWDKLNKQIRTAEGTAVWTGRRPFMGQIRLL
jgi:hypothetical protein